MILENMPEPNQMMIIGARAIFGRPFKATMKGSMILAVVRENHNSRPHTEPSTLPRRKPAMVAETVARVSSRS